MAEYMGVVEGVGCRRVVLDEYLDGVVDGYQWRYCQDADAGEQACDGYDPDWAGLVEPAGVGSSPVPGEAGHQVVREAARAAPCQAGSMVARQAAREAACKAGSIVRREGAREGACKSGRMVAREGARKAACESGSMVAREAAREAPCEAGSMVVRQAASPTPSNDSFCSQPAIPMDVWHAQQAQAQQ